MSNIHFMVGYIDATKVEVLPNGNIRPLHRQVEEPVKKLAKKR